MNKNPSPSTRFGGPRGNPNGKTAEQKQAELRNAELATKIRARMLEAVHNTVTQVQADGSVLDHIEANILKLLKDAEDRGLGTPQSNVDVTTNGKDMPGAVDPATMSDEELQTLRKVLRGNV